MFLNFTESISENYWQLTTENIAFRCPYENSCKGGIFPLNYTTNGTQLNNYLLHDNDCFEEFSGYLCSKTASDRDYIDFIARDIESCNWGNGFNGFTVACLFTIIIFCCYFFSIFIFIKKTPLKKPSAEETLQLQLSSSASTSFFKKYSHPSLLSLISVKPNLGERSLDYLFLLKIQFFGFQVSDPIILFHCLFLSHY
jgi:hypothetical protein